MEYSSNVSVSALMKTAGIVATCCATSYMLISRQWQVTEDERAKVQQQAILNQESVSGERKGEENLVVAEQRLIKIQAGCGAISTVSIALFSLKQIGAWKFSGETTQSMLAARSLSLSALPLFFGVMNVASRRMPDVNTPAEVTSGQNAKADKELRLSLSFLGNTTEQFLIHVACQLGLACSLSPEYAALIPINACLFTFGRALFYVGYAKMPIMRGYGLNYTLFPSLLGLVYVNVKTLAGFDLISLRRI